MNNILPAEDIKLKSKQVSPLPIGPGGNNPIKNEMNQTNIQLTMLQSQALADTKYDPPVPEPITKQVVKEGFTNHTNFSILFMIGGLLVVYGLVAK
jgi:hypothetical protein